jgi:hypothetical protein
MKYAAIVTLLLLIVIIPSVSATEPTTAEENDPRINEDANACFIGGTWEGQCDTVDVNHDGTVDQWEKDMIYIAGWYLIRFEYGMISRNDFPAAYVWALPPVPQVTPPPPAPPTLPPMPPASFCYDSTLSGYVDVQYSGVPNIPTNLMRFSSTNGTCSTSIGPSASAYIVDNPANCLLPFVNTGSAYGYTTLPTSLYICITSAP